jgi:nicotinamidase/pyrazinamidase
MNRKALIVVDVQNDFCPGGALPVPDGDKVVDVANAISREFPVVVFTKDFHPKDHGSFASNHPGEALYSLSTLDGLPQVLWPDHCVEGTEGSHLHPKLEMPECSVIYYKGKNPKVDSYSGFYDNGHKQSTGLSEFLKSQNITEVWIMGLATDYCIKATALDAVKEGFKTRLILRGCKAVNVKPDDETQAINEMIKAGVGVIMGDPEIALKQGL